MLGESIGTKRVISSERQVGGTQGYQKGQVWMKGKLLQELLRHQKGPVTKEVRKKNKDKGNK